MRGIFDQVQLQGVQQPRFIDQFSDQMAAPIQPQLTNEFADLLQADTFLDHWHNGRFDSVLGYYFLDDVMMNHPILDTVIDTVLNDVVVSTETLTLLTALHQRLALFIMERPVNARALANLEMAVIRRFFDQHQLACPDLHAYDARTIFNEVSYGILWPVQGGWQHLGVTDSHVSAFNMDHFEQVELIGRQNQTIYPNGARYDQQLNVIDADHAQVIALVNAIFENGYDGIGVNDIAQRIHQVVTGFDYIPEPVHQWQSLDMIFKQGGGDCEDLAHLEASLLTRALIDAGFEDVANSITLVAGAVGAADGLVGHTILQYHDAGVTIALDSTMINGPMTLAQYQTSVGFYGITTYGATSSINELAAAAAIDTKATKLANVPKLKESFLGAMGLGTIETDSNKVSNGGFLLGQLDNGYYAKAKKFYETVTDTSKNTSFWEIQAESISDQVAGKVISPTKGYEPLDIGDIVLVGSNTKSFDIHTGIKGLIEAPINRLNDMSSNLTKTTLNKYVGQTFNGYYIYDYSRIMDDYTKIMDSIQLLNCYLTAMMTYANSFNWIGSQLTNEEQPHSEVGGRQKFIKTVQGAIFKMVDEVEYFVTLFTQTYDDLNSGIYARMKQEVGMQFQSVASALNDVFLLDEDSIKKNKLLQKVEAEYWYVMAKNRELVMQSNVTMPSARALTSFLDFTHPNSNILDKGSGKPGGFAEFQRQMELDIIKGVRKPVRVGTEFKYIDPIDYYFAYYKMNGDINDTNIKIDYYDDLVVSTKTSDILAKSFIENTAVFETAGLDTVKEGFMGFIDYPDWLENPGVSSTDNRPVNDANTFGDVTKANFKNTDLYKYLHARAMPFHQYFESEAYMNETELWQKDFTKRINFMGRKRRFDVLDFVDIFEFNLNPFDRTQDAVRANQLTTSGDFFDVLKTKFVDSDGIEKTFVDEDGIFTQDLVTKLYTDTPPVEGGFYQFITRENKVANPNSNWTMAQDNALKARFYSMVGLEEYNMGNLEYDFKRVQLFTRTTDELTANGYIDPYENKVAENDRYVIDLAALEANKLDPFIRDLNPSQSGDSNYHNKTADTVYQFAKRQFYEGETQSAKVAMDSSSDFAASSAKAGSDSKPAKSTIVVKDWSQIDTSQLIEIITNVDANGLVTKESYTISAILDELKKNYPNDGFFDKTSKWEVTVAQQETFEAKYQTLGEGDQESVQSDYGLGVGGVYTSKGSTWTTKDFMKYSGEGDENTKPPFPKMATSGAAATIGTYDPITPVASIGYDFDYGVSERLLFDQNRVVSKDTEDKFTSQVKQGPKILGTIEYATENVDVATHNAWRQYDGLFSSQTLSTLNQYRESNTLEKFLTPVVSFNDESYVIDYNNVKSALGLGDEGQFLSTMQGLETAGLVTSVFNRFDGTNKYRLVGYNFKAGFFSRYKAPKDGKPGFLDGVTLPYGGNITNLHDYVKRDYFNHWHHKTLEDMFGKNTFGGEGAYFSADQNYLKSDFLTDERRSYQLIRWVGETSNNSLNGVERLPMMATDWHALKTAHNGMLSMQNRIRLFYFVIQATIASFQSIAKRLDGLANTGTAPLEGDLQVLEKRIAKQTELFSQINAKTSQFVQVNNAYYNQQLTTIKTGDIGIRVAKGLQLYSPMVSGIAFGVSVGLKAASAAASAASAAAAVPNPPLSASLAAAATNLGIGAQAAMIAAQVAQTAANAGKLTEEIIKFQHDTFYPGRMGMDVLSKDTASASIDANSEFTEPYTPDQKKQAIKDFRAASDYKSPVTLDNGFTWESNYSLPAKVGTISGSDPNAILKSIYNTVSPLAANSKFKYVPEGGARDVWQAPATLVDEKEGDCEDYAVLAASLAVKNGINSSNLRVVNGLVGYGDHFTALPKSHTVLLYDSKGKFEKTDADANGRKQFTDTAGIQVIDLTVGLNNGSFYSLSDYNTNFGFFQPMYSYDQPGNASNKEDPINNAKLDYGFKNYEIFGYNPSGFVPPEPKGPKDMSGISDGYGYTYDINQTSFRKAKITIKKDGSTVEERFIDTKIPYGQASFDTTNPDGTAVTLNLAGNYESPAKHSSQDPDDMEAVIGSDMPGGQSVPSDAKQQDPSNANQHGTLSNKSAAFQSKGVVGRNSGAGASAGLIHSDIVTDHMRNFLQLELEEHAVLSEMFNVAVDPLNLSNHPTGWGKAYLGYDWPKFQMLQRRLFVIQLKMKKTFLVMKLRAEFISLIGTRLGEFQRQQMSGAMDSIYSSHFTKMANSVEGLQTAMSLQQSIGQVNFQKDYSRAQAGWSLAFEIYSSVKSELINWGAQLPVIANGYQQVMSVLKSLFLFFVLPSNPFYLKSPEGVRGATAMVDEDNYIEPLKELFGSIDYAKVGTGNTDPFGKVYNPEEKFPINSEMLNNVTQWVSQNEMRLNQDSGDSTKAYTLKIDNADKRKALKRVSNKMGGINHNFQFGTDNLTQLNNELQTLIDGTLDGSNVLTFYDGYEYAGNTMTSQSTVPSSFLQAIKNDVVDLQAYGSDKTIVEEWWDEYGYDSPTLRTIYTGDTDIVPHRDKIQNKLEKMTLPFRPSDNLSVLQTQLQSVIDNYDTYNPSTATANPSPNNIRYTQEVYEGATQKVSGSLVSKSALETIKTEIATTLSKPLPAISLEDHVLYRMSTRFLPGDGNSLMFLDSGAYKMSGAKLVSDEDFFDWIQGRMAAEMMIQSYMSMVISSYRSITNSLGFSSTGGNDAIQASTSFTGEIGQHYFTLHNTLTSWEQLIIDINNMRFDKWKELDQLILEGIISVVSLGVSSVAGSFGSVGGKLGMALNILNSVAMTVTAMAGQLTQMIYNLVDAAEENKVLENSQQEEAELDKDNLDNEDKLSESKMAEKRLQKERKAVGEETLKTAGNTSTGFGSTYVDQSAKLKMKRKSKEMFKMFEVQQKMGASRAEMMKSLAASLGASTGQASIGGGLSQITGMAKQANDQALETRFKLMEAVAARDNEISGAMRSFIMAVATQAITQTVKTGVKKVRKNKAKKKAPKVKSKSISGKKEKKVNKDPKKRAGKAKKEAYMDFLVDQILDNIGAMVSGLVMAAIMIGEIERISSEKDEQGMTKDGGIAQDRDEGVKDLQADGKSMGEAIAAKEGESPGGERASQLSGLEARAEVASFSQAQAQDMAAAGDLINQLYKQATKYISDAITAVFKVDKDKMKKGKKALAKQLQLQKEGGPGSNTTTDSIATSTSPEDLQKNMAGIAKQTANALGKAGADMGGGMIGSGDIGQSAAEMMQLSKTADSMAKSAQQDKKERQSLKDKPVGGNKAARFLSAVSNGAKNLVGNAGPKFWRDGINDEDLKVEVATERAKNVKENAVAMVLAAEMSGNGTPEGKAFLAQNPAVLAKVLGELDEKGGALDAFDGATAQDMLKEMISSEDSNLQKAAAGAIANMPQSAAANMENVMDSFTNSFGVLNAEGMMDFMTTLSNDGGELGQKMARQMLDSGSPFNPDDAEAQSGLINKAKYGFNKATIIASNFSKQTGIAMNRVLRSGEPSTSELNKFNNATYARFMQLVKDPDMAQRVAQLRAKGLPDPKSKFQHQIKNGSNGMVRMLKSIKNQMEDGEGTEDVAKSMAELYAGGEEGNTDGVGAINKTEKNAIVGVLKKMIGKDKGGETMVKQSLEDVLKSTADPGKKAAVNDLAKKLGITLEDDASEGTNANTPVTEFEEAALQRLAAQPSSGGGGGPAAALNAVAAAGKGDGKGAPPSPGSKANPNLLAKKAAAKIKLKSLQKQLAKGEAAGAALNAQSSSQPEDSQEIAALKEKIKNKKGKRAVFQEKGEALTKQISGLNTTISKEEKEQAEVTKRIEEGTAKLAELGNVDVVQLGKDKEYFRKKLDGADKAPELIKEYQQASAADKAKLDLKEGNMVCELLGVKPGSKAGQFILKAVKDEGAKGKDTFGKVSFIQKRLDDKIKALEGGQNFKQVAINSVTEKYNKVLAGHMEAFRQRDLERKHELAKKLPPELKGMIQMGASMEDVLGKVNEAKKRVEKDFNEASSKLEAAQGKAAAIKKLQEQLGADTKRQAELGESIESNKGKLGEAKSEQKKNNAEMDKIDYGSEDGSETALADDETKLDELQKAAANNTKNSAELKKNAASNADLKKQIKEQEEKLKVIEGAIAFDATTPAKTGAATEGEAQAQSKGKRAAAATGGGGGGTGAVAGGGGGTGGGGAGGGTGGGSVAATGGTGGGGGGGAAGASGDGGAKPVGNDAGPLASAGVGGSDNSGGGSEGGGGGAPSTVGVGGGGSAPAGGNTQTSTVAEQAAGSEGAPPPKAGARPISGGANESSPTKAGQGGSVGSAPATTTGPGAAMQAVEKPSGGEVPTDSNSTHSTTREDKMAAGLLSTVARIAGLENPETHTPVDERLTGKPESINFDKADDIVKEIIKSANAAKDTEAAGVVRDFLSAAGIQIGEDKAIPEFDAKTLTSGLITKDAANDFMENAAKETTGQVTQTDPDNNVKPVDKQHIYNVIETVVKGLTPADSPINPQQVNPNAGGSKADSTKTDAVGGGGATSGVGNTPKSPDAGQRPKPDALTAEPETQSTGEVTPMHTENQDPKGATKSGMNSRQQKVQDEIDSANKALKTNQAERKELKRLNSELGKFQGQIESNQKETRELNGQNAEQQKKIEDADQQISKLKKAEQLKTIFDADELGAYGDNGPTDDQIKARILELKADQKDLGFAMVNGEILKEVPNSLGEIAVEDTPKIKELNAQKETAQGKINKNNDEIQKNTTALAGLNDKKRAAQAEVDTQTAKMAGLKTDEELNKTIAEKTAKLKEIEAEEATVSTAQPSPEQLAVETAQASFDKANRKVDFLQNKRVPRKKQRTHNNKLNKAKSDLKDAQNKLSAAMANLNASQAGKGEGVGQTQAPVATTKTTAPATTEKSQTPSTFESTTDVAKAVKDGKLTMFEGMKEMKALIENAPTKKNGQLDEDFTQKFAEAMETLSDIEDSGNMSPMTVLNMIHEETASGVFDTGRPIAHQLMQSMLTKAAEKGESSKLSKNVGDHISKHPEFLNDMTTVSRKGTDVPIDTINRAHKGSAAGSDRMAVATARQNFSHTMQGFNEKLDKADEKVAAQKAFKTANTLFQRTTHPEKLAAAKAKMGELHITATDNLESKDQITSNAIQDMKMMVRVGIQELRQEHAEGIDINAADLANLQDMLVTIETFQRQPKPTSLEGQAVLLEVMSHTQTMKTDVFGGFDPTKAIKELKTNLKDQAQQMVATLAKDKGPTPEMRTLGTLARLPGDTFKEVMAGVNPGDLTKMVDQNFDKFSKSDRINLSIKLLGAMKPDDAGAIADTSVPQPPSTDSTAEPTALTLPENKALMDKLKTELGGSILPLIAQHQVPTQTLDELIGQLEGDQKTEAELMRAVVTGADSEGVVKDFPDNITSEQLNHVMSFATDAQLETVFSNANNANKMVELLGKSDTNEQVRLLNDISANDKKIASLEKEIGIKQTAIKMAKPGRKRTTKLLKQIEKFENELKELKDKGTKLQNDLEATGTDFKTALDKKAILKRLQSRPQLAALLMKQVPDQSSTAATTVEEKMGALADAGATTGAQKLNFFKQLGSVAQQHVMSQLQDDQVASLVGNALQEVGSGDNQLLSIIASAAKENPGAFQTAVDKQTDMSHFLDALDGSADTKQTKAILAQLTPAQVGSVAKEANIVLNNNTDEGKNYENLGHALRESNPSAFLSAFMDNSNVESFQDEFKAAFTTSSGSMDWQAIGEAGNKNPKLMAKVLDQLGAPIGGAGLPDQLAGLADAGQSLSQQIVMAMANQNSLAFTLNFDSMPAQIRNQVVTGDVHSQASLSGVPQPPEQPVAAAPSDTDGPKLSASTQMRLLGLTMGVGAASLTGPKAEQAVKEQLTATLMDGSVSDTKKANIKQAIASMGREGESLQAQADLVGLLENPSSASEIDESKLRSIFAFADPNMIPGGEDQMTKLDDLTTTINGRLDDIQKSEDKLAESVNLKSNKQKRSFAKKIAKNVPIKNSLKALNSMLCVRGYALQQEAIAGDGSQLAELGAELLEFTVDSTFVGKMGFNMDDGPTKVRAQMATKLQQDLGNIPTIKSEDDVHTGADLAFFKPETSTKTKIGTLGLYVFTNANTFMSPMNARSDALIKNMQPQKPVGDVGGYLDGSSSTEGLTESQAKTVVAQLKDRLNDKDSSIDAGSAFNLLTALESSQPGVVNPTFNQCVTALVDQAGDNISTHFDGATVGTQQKIIDTLNQKGIESSDLKSKQLQNKLLSQMSETAQGTVSSAQIDHQQLGFKADVEEAMNALPDGVSKQAFLQDLTDKLGASFKSQGPNSNAVHLAKMRGLQQAIADVDIPIDAKQRLNSQLSQTGMAAILTSASHQLPVSERSMDHMAHLLYGLDAASQTQAVATLANHMEPADFNRLQSRVALHVRASGSDASTALSSLLTQAKNTAMFAEGSTAKMAQAPYVVKKYAGQLAGLKRGVRAAVKDLVNDKSIGTNIKSQIFTEMMVRNPGGFSTALQQLNKDGSDDILGGILDQVSGDPGLKQLFDDTYNGRYNAQDRLFNQAVPLNRMAFKALMLAESMVMEPGAQRPMLGIKPSIVFDTHQKALSSAVQRLAKNPQHQASVDKFLGQTNNVYTLANYTNKVGSDSLTSMAENGHLSDQTMTTMLDSASYLRSSSTLDRTPANMHKTVKNLTTKLIHSLDSQPVIKQSEQQSTVPQPPTETAAGKGDSTSPAEEKIQATDRRVKLLQTALMHQPQGNDSLFKPLPDVFEGSQPKGPRTNSFSKNLQKSMTSKLRFNTSVGVAVSRNLLDQNGPIGESKALKIMQGTASTSSITAAYRTLDRGIARGIANTKQAAKNKMVDIMPDSAKRFVKSRMPRLFVQKPQLKPWKALDIGKDLNLDNPTDIKMAAMAYSHDTKMGAFSSKKLADAIKKDPNQGRVLAAAVKEGYITASELNTVVKRLGDNGLKSMIQAAYPPGVDGTGDRAAPTTEMEAKIEGVADAGQTPANEGLKQDLDDLLPKMMGAYAQKTGGESARTTLKTVFSALDNVDVKVPTPPTSGDAAVPIQHKALKDDIVTSMSDHMVTPEEGINGYRAPDSKPTFTSAFGQQLQQVTGAPMDRDVAQKLQAIEDDLAAVKPEEKGLLDKAKDKFNPPTVRDLFKKHDLEPQRVGHLFANPSSPNFATTFNNMLNTSQLKAAQHGKQLNPQRQALLTVAREHCKDQSPQQFNQQLQEIITRR